MLKTKFEKIDWHRNGVGGTGFYIGLFEMEEEGRKDKMVGIRLSKENDKETGGVNCFVVRLADLVNGDLNNHLRGDYFADDFDAAIKAHDRREDNRRKKEVAEHRRRRGAK